MEKDLDHRVVFTVSCREDSPLGAIVVFLEQQDCEYLTSFPQFGLLQHVTSVANYEKLFSTVLRCDYSSWYEQWPHSTMPEQIAEYALGAGLDARVKYNPVDEEYFAEHPEEFKSIL